MDQQNPEDYAALSKKFLVETDELEQLIKENAPRLKIVQASWFAPNAGVDVAEAHKAKRITKETLLFNHDTFKDQTSKLPNTLPSVDHFQSCMKSLGLEKTDQIVVYDSHPMGILGVSRAAWMMRYFGAQNVRILNGGLKKWEAEGKPVVQNQEAEKVEGQENGDFSYGAASGEDLCITDIGEMHKIAALFHQAPSESTQTIQIVDARPQGAFDSGHIHGSLCIPFPGLLNENGTMKSGEELAQIYKSAGASQDKLTYNLCGIGMSACINDLAQKLIGVKQTCLYDGSWTEYSQVPEPDFKK